MPVANQDCLARLAVAISRLERVAEKLGTANVPVKKLQGRGAQLGQLVSRLEKTAASLENKSNLPASQGDNGKAVTNSQGRAQLGQLVSRLENTAPSLENKSNLPASDGDNGKVVAMNQFGRVQLGQLVSRFENTASYLGKKSCSTADGGGKAVERFDEIIKGKVASFLSFSDQIGGNVKAQAHVVQNAFEAQRDFILKSTKTKKPIQDVFAAMLRKTSLHMETIEEFKDKERGSQVFNHLSAVSKGIGALGWVTAIGKPSDFVKENSDAAQFYLDRVLKESKEKDRRQVDWARAFQGTLASLNEYVKDLYPAGLTWGK